MTNKKVRLLIYFSALSAGTLLISNLCAVKLWDFFGIAVDGGIVLFPLSYILGDLCVEMFGRKTSRTILLSSFVINLIAVAAFNIAIALPPFPGWEMQAAFASVLGFSLRIVGGSLCGYLLSGLLNNVLFVKMKESNGWLSKSFIGRALCSSVFAHIIDTAVFETIAFLGVLPFSDFLAQAVFAYVAGMGLELILSPIEILIQRRLVKYVQE